jgi:uncharacterized protein YcfJ
MINMNIGIFSNRIKAEEAILALEKAGFNPKEISFVMKDIDEAQAVSENTGASIAGGAASGATTGGVVGGLAGLLIGLGTITIPGIGALFITGPITAALGLTGAAATTISGAVTGALAGGLVGALVGLGVPQETAEVYEDRVNTGGVLLAVPAKLADSRIDSRSIMEKYGADQIRSVSI